MTVNVCKLLGEPNFALLSKTNKFFFEASKKVHQGCLQPNAINVIKTEVFEIFQVVMVNCIGSSFL